MAGAEPSIAASAEATRPCPFCGEAILYVAKKCKHCGEFLDNTPKKTVREVVETNMKQGALIGAIVCFALGVLLMYATLLSFIVYSPLLLAAFILSIVAMAGHVVGGVLMLVVTVVVPPIVFLTRFASTVPSPPRFAPSAPMTADDSGASSAKATPGDFPTPTLPPTPTESSARLGQAVTIGQLRVTPKMVEFRKVRSKYRSDSGTQEPVLALSVVVENISKGEVFEPYTSADGSDNFGNTLDQVKASGDTFFAEGSAEFDDLKPGQKATVIVCLKPKTETATSYQWHISQKCGNRENARQGWNLTFDASEIIRKNPTSKESAWVDASKESASVGSVRVSVVSAKTGIVTLVSTISDNEYETNDSLLSIRVTIENLGQQKKLEYGGWACDVESSDEGCAKLIDDAGNKYHCVRYGTAKRVKDAFTYGSIYPHTPVQDTLNFQVPVHGIKFLRLTLPGSVVKEDNDFHFQIPIGMVKKN